MIKGPEMFIISFIGLVVNLYVVIKMKAEEKENLNVRGAYLHILSDTVSSVGVVIAGLLITITGNYIFDPFISAFIGVVILISCLRLIKESIQILMEAVPTHIDLKKVSDDIRKINYVKEVHDIHIWSIASDVFALSSHILIDAKDVKSLNKIISQINEMLKSKYNITHSVIQPECECCVDKNNYCSLTEKSAKE